MGAFAAPQNAAKETGGNLDAIKAAVQTPAIPAGAATAANQASALTKLDTLHGDLGGIGAQADAAATSDTGTFSLLALIKRLLGKFPVLVSGRMPVDGSGVTQPISGTVGVSGTVPVSGTFFQTTQPVSGTVGISGTVPVSGTFFQATQPVSLAAIPIATGAATSAKQPALGTAGTASTDVISVQGIASMTALKVDGSAVTQPISGTVGVSGTVPVSGTFFQATQPVSGTVGISGTVPVSGTVSVSGASANGQATMANSKPVAIASDQSALPVTGTFYQATQPVSATALPLPTGAATSAAQTTGNTSIASIDTKTPALGQTTMANSRPVTLASDQPLTNSTSSASLSALNAACTISVAGFTTVAFQITGTWSATVSPEVTIDGTTWINCPFWRADAAASNLFTQANGIFIVPCSGVKQARMRCSSYISGTVVVTGFASCAAPVCSPAVVSTNQLVIGSMGFGSSVTDTTTANILTASSGNNGSFPFGVCNYVGTGTNALTVQKGNLEISVLASAARTATTNSSDQTNNNGRGVMVVLNVTAASGTGGLTVQIQGKDSISGSYYNLNAAPTGVTATGMTVYELYPEPGAASGGVTQVTGRILPRTWRVAVTAGDASSYTYSVSAVNLV